MKRINLALSLIVAFGLGACGSADSPSRGAGGVTFDLAWQEAGPVLTIPDSQPFAFAPSRFYPQALPVAVVSLRATITGLDMEQLEQTFSGLYPAGGTIVVRRVPSGDNRNLVLDGLNSANAIIYQGSISGFTVVAEQANDIGQIVMSPYGEGIVAAPSNLQAQAVSSSRIELSWADNANNETGFYIERKTSSGSAYSLLGSVGRDVTRYQDENLSCGTVYFYRVFAYGAVENSGYSNETSAFVPCVETVITLAPFSPTQSPDPLFGFSCNFASCSFECDLDGGGYSICASPHGYTGLADGQHVFSVRAVDISGHADFSPMTFSWNIDRVPPETSITSSPVSPSDAEVAFGFACDEGNCTYECSMDSSGFSACPVPSVFRLENGAHTLSVRAIDQAGNVDASPADYSWLVIALPPWPPGEEIAPEPIGSWVPVRSRTVPTGREYHTAVWTGTEMIVWGGLDQNYNLVNTGGRYNPSTDTWTPTAIDANTPTGREYHGAVWTGTGMIVLGGYDGYTALPNGGQYSPATDSWSYFEPQMPTEGRENPSVVWTGAEMIVWGGYGDGYYHNSGNVYDPVSDVWTSTSVDASTPWPRQDHTAVWTGMEMIIWGGNDGSYLNNGGRYNPASDSWSATSISASTPPPRQDHTAVWTGTEMIVWGGYDGTYLNDGGLYNPSTNSWKLTNNDETAPAVRRNHTAVWTGTEMIVWGGYYYDGMYYYPLSTGGRYDPVGDTWMSTFVGTGVPSGRRNHTAVWDEVDGWMIIWGGDSPDMMGGLSTYLSDGSRYSPASDTWAPTSGTGVPSLRSGHTAVWTGTEMIVWGGYYYDQVTPPYDFYLADGGRYNPSADTWTATSGTTSARVGHVAVWNGTEMLLWGGFDGTAYHADGSGYDPVQDSWRPIGTGMYGVARIGASVVWTGQAVLFWGGYCFDGSNTYYPNTGVLLDPASGDLRVISMGANVPSGRAFHTAVWTGTEMIVWGGVDQSYAYLNDGGVYTLSTDSWMPTSQDANVPSGREYHTAVWTGTEMIVWGGDDGSYSNTGGRYNPSLDSWLTTDTGANVPSARENHTAVWTGSDMIVWGGYYHSGVGAPDYLNDGGKYSPSGDSWTPTSTGMNVPTAREYHTAVWDGQDGEMIVWGGYDGSNYLDTGGRYNSAGDSWTPTDIGAGIPSGRQYHTAVWTGTEMIVWGGGVPSEGWMFSNDGGRYDPVTDSWTPTGIDGNTPSARGFHRAVWTGAEMIIWGGEDGYGGYLNDGGRYDPATDSWMLTAVDENTPPGREGFSTVWTGSEMIVWGGYYYDNYTPPYDFYFNDGGRYDPATDSWTPTGIDMNTPAGREYHTAVWNDKDGEMIVWGGSYHMGIGNDGGRYSPSSDSWTPISMDANVPTARENHTAVWTGYEMIVWGGYDGSYLNDGGRYNSATDSWKPVTTKFAPSGRENHTAVWALGMMIVWGGTDGDLYYRDGGVYEPSGDYWVGTALHGAPRGRENHTAVWTGTDMIVWGGDVYNFMMGNEYLDTGGRFSFKSGDPAGEADELPYEGSGGEVIVN